MTYPQEEVWKTEHIIYYKQYLIFFLNEQHLKYGLVEK